MEIHRIQGENLFGKTALRKSAFVEKPCIFISHSKKDKDYAKTIATALLAMCVDVYFDEQDRVLQQASSLGDDRAIVKCIEDGLDNSSHLLGLITNNSRNSWWVSYEIGGATGRKTECAHLVAPEVEEVPSFIKISKLLLDQYDVSNWVANLTKRQKSAVDENIQKSLAFAKFSSALPSFRAQDKLKFY